MLIKRRAAAMMMVFSFAFGILASGLTAARADSGPIIVGKPIIHKDPKPQPKGN